jgi:hypothetical protein
MSNDEFAPNAEASHYDNSQVMTEYKRHLEEVDELALIVLKGHLLIEGLLDKIIYLAVFHVEYLTSARLSFNQKLLLARSLCREKHDISIWMMIGGINALRNKIAHGLDDDRRRASVSALRRLFLTELEPEQVAQFEGFNDEQISYYACAMSVGFLEIFESDTKALRSIIENLRP